MDKRHVKVEIDYPGCCISVNHYRGRTRDGGEYVRADAKAWMNELGWAIKSYHIEDWKLPLSVTCDGVFQGKAHQPDLSNLSKCTLDAIEEITGINDREMRWHDGHVEYNQKPVLTITVKPYLYITIEEAENDK